MHNAAYAALGMNRTYVAFRVTSANLASALRAIHPLGIIGVNLTVPHKEAAARLIKDLSGEARMLGAVNCVVNRRGALRGDNTDARGLERDLRDLGCDLHGRLAIVIGAGGGCGVVGPRVRPTGRESGRDREPYACARRGTRAALLGEGRARGG